MATYYAFSGCSSGQVLTSSKVVDGSLTLDKFYFAQLQIYAGGVTVDCYRITTGTTPTVGITYGNGPFDSCALCNASRTPISAGTNYIYCQITCSGDYNVTTVAKTVPHAVWSNGANVDVIQMNSIALGGFNGLNS